MALYGSLRMVHNGSMPNERISVRCPAVEIEAIQGAADALGLTRTGFVRMILRKESARVLMDYGKRVPFLDLPGKQEVEQDADGCAYRDGDRGRNLDRERK